MGGKSKTKEIMNTEFKETKNKRMEGKSKAQAIATYLAIEAMTSQYNFNKYEKSNKVEIKTELTKKQSKSRAKNKIAKNSRKINRKK